MCACTPFTDHRRTRPDCPRCALDWAIASAGQLPPYTDETAMLTLAAEYEAAEAVEHNHPGRGYVREYHWDRWEPAPTRPAVVLDPFGGTGTTALAALALGRDAITVDRSWDYCRAAAWRTADPEQLAIALGVPKPPPQHDDQAALFGRDELAAT